MGKAFGRLLTSPSIPLPILPLRRAGDSPPAASSTTCPMATPRLSFLQPNSFILIRYSENGYIRLLGLSILNTMKAKSMSCTDPSSAPALGLARDGGSPPSSANLKPSPPSSPPHLTIPVNIGVFSFFPFFG